MKGRAEPVGLDFDADHFEKYLEEASNIVLRLYSGLETTRITPAKTRAAIVELLDEPMPEDPESMNVILQKIETDMFANSTLNLSPRFFGYINSGGNQASILAELLATALNQICALWHFSPAASELERLVTRWIGEFIGYPPKAAGCLLSGGSAGNLTGLAVAREHIAKSDIGRIGVQGGPAHTVYVSQEGHASIEKSMALLGLGSNQLRKIPVQGDFTIDLCSLAAEVEKDRADGCQPMCVVGNAGTTNTGAVDPLAALADFCRDQQLWFHLDASYGGLAAKGSAAGHLFKGLDRADSIVINPHKWLYVPVEASCILVKDPRALRSTFRVRADYLDGADEVRQEDSLDFKDLSPQLSRSFRALKVWMTFKAYGATQLRNAIDSNISIMRYLADLIDESNDFVRLAPVTLSVVCFQYRTSDPSRHEDHEYLDMLNVRLLEAIEKDGRIFLSATTINGRKALRACSVNHRLRQIDVAFLLYVIRDVAVALGTTP